MAGLVPERRNREELDRANNALLERHREHLRSWVADRTAASESERSANRDSRPRDQAQLSRNR